MIIPIRCFTCGKVLADKWEYFKRQCDEASRTSTDVQPHQSTYFEPAFKGAILDDLNLHKMCCRRHMLGHVDLIHTL